MAHPIATGTKVITATCRSVVISAGMPVSGRITAGISGTAKTAAAPYR